MKWLIVVLLAVAGFPAAGAAADAALTVDDLGWLAGCWASVGGEPGSGEQWSVPAGGTLLGAARTVRDGATVAWEFLQIRESGEGRIELVAEPSGQDGATFALVGLSDREVVFENPEHDFPQRIRYRLEAEGRLDGRIEGELDGELRAIDFPMRRIDCRTGS